MINHNGKEKFKVYIYTHTYIYITESLCYTAEINTVFEISYSSTSFKNKENEGTETEIRETDT